MAAMRALTKSSARNLLILLIAVGIIGIMFWSTKKHDKIRVEFVETGKDKPFAVSMVPIGQLPETFEVATKLDIADKQWSVVDAAPKHRSEFERTGKLRVVLSPLQMVNPKDILFSLPTINDRMCALQKAKSLDGMLVIHEDDWRQVEFVSEKLLGDVETEIKSVRTIYETKRKGAGFTGVHVRKLIETPIDGVIPYSAFKNLFGVSKEFSGFGISSYMAVAEHGFAFETTDGLRFYGVLNQEGNVVVLCLANTDGFADKCREMMTTFHLVGVNWCKCQTTQN
jgi:hypothetical protein